MDKPLSRPSFEKILKDKGLKITPGRLEMLSILKAHHVPMTAEDIFAKMKGADRATIYRTLSSFADAGIVKHIDLHKESGYFELDDDHHHHLVCTDCGAIEDITLCGIESTARRALKKSSFKEISAHSLELFGICKRCAKA